MNHVSDAVDSPNEEGERKERQKCHQKGSGKARCMFDSCSFRRQPFICNPQHDGKCMKEKKYPSLYDPSKALTGGLYVKITNNAENKATTKKY